MKLKIFTSSEYEVIPDTHLIRKYPQYNVLKIDKPYHHYVVANNFGSSWYWDGEKLYLKRLLMYNDTMFILLKNNFFQFDLTSDDLLKISSNFIPLKFLGFICVSKKDQIKIKRKIKIELNNEISVIDISNFFRLEYGNIYSLTDEYVIIKKNQSDDFIMFKFVLKNEEIVPFSFKLLENFTDDDDLSVKIYNTPKHFIVDESGVLTSYKTDPFSYKKTVDPLFNKINFYLNKDLILKSNNLVLYISPMYHGNDPEGRVNMIITGLELHIEPVEIFYAKWLKSKPFYDFISLGSFVRLNPTTNHWRLFKNNLLVPAFTEHTVYKICNFNPNIPDLFNSEEDKDDNPTDVPSLINNQIRNPEILYDPYLIVKTLLLVYDYQYYTSEIFNVSSKGVYNVAVFDFDKIKQRDYNPVALYRWYSNEFDYSVIDFNKQFILFDEYIRDDILELNSTILIASTLNGQVKLFSSIHLTNSTNLPKYISLNSTINISTYIDDSLKFKTDINVITIQGIKKDFTTNIIIQTEPDVNQSFFWEILNFEYDTVIGSYIYDLIIKS